MLLSRKIVSSDSLLQLSLLLLIINTVIVTGRRHNREVEYGGNYGDGSGSETIINELDDDSLNLVDANIQANLIKSTILNESSSSIIITTTTTSTSTISATNTNRQNYEILNNTIGATTTNNIDKKSEQLDRAIDEYITKTTPSSIVLKISAYSLNSNETNSSSSQNKLQSNSINPTNNTKIIDYFTTTTTTLQTTTRKKLNLRILTRGEGRFGDKKYSKLIDRQQSKSLNNNKLSWLRRPKGLAKNAIASNSEYRLLRRGHGQFGRRGPTPTVKNINSNQYSWFVISVTTPLTPIVDFRSNYVPQQINNPYRPPIVDQYGQSSNSITDYSHPTIGQHRPCNNYQHPQPSNSWLMANHALPPCNNRISPQQQPYSPLQQQQQQPYSPVQQQQQQPYSPVQQQQQQPYIAFQPPPTNNHHDWTNYVMHKTKCCTCRGVSQLSRLMPLEITDHMLKTNDCHRCQHQLFHCTTL